MNKISLTFTANQQELKNTTKNVRLASGTVDYVEATFDLGDNWSGFDSVRAIWSKKTELFATVLDAYGYCQVPNELLEDKGTIKVNLVGSIAEEVEGEEVLTDRLTTFQAVALSVSQLVPLDGDETSPLTPSQFEQFVLIVQGYSEDAVDAKEAAETAQGLAETAQGLAETAQAGAETAETNAQGYAENASGSADSASQSATASQGFASDASNYADSASTSADNASASATSAQGYATTASGYADDAQGYANDASGYADTASSEADRAEEAREAIEDMTVSAHAETGTTPTVTKTIVDDVVNLDFGLIRGEKGEQGDTGQQGPEGPPGVGVPTGGTIGQVLAKASNTDYDTQWINSGGGGTSDYDDLSNRPKINNVLLTGNKSSSDLGIPTVNDATLTIQKNGVNVNTFTANASSNVTANIIVPTAAADVGAIAAPASPATGAFLVWDGNAWTAQTLSVWQGGNY